MRRTTVWQAGVLAALAALLPGGAFGQSPGTFGEWIESMATPTKSAATNWIARGQSPGTFGEGTATGVSVGPDYAPPANGNLPLPLYNTQPSLGGLYLNAGFIFLQQTNPIKGQPIAYRGFIDVDGSATGQGVGSFIGSRTIALDANQITGPTSFEPGFTAGIGYRFTDGSVFSIDYTYLAMTHYTAAATVAPPGLQVGVLQAESFLTAFVFNFPAELAGPPFKVANGNPEALFGIWNGASVMTLSFQQLYWQLEATYRIPIYETECYRLSGLVGPRYVRLEDKFQWTTTDTGTFNQGVVQTFSLPQWSDIYNNIVSNNLYGIHVGVQSEWYLGHGFAAMLTVQGAAFLDVARQQVSYDIGLKDAAPQTKRTIRQYSVAAEAQVTPALQWYPWEGIQCRLGYDLFAFFNTMSSPHPVDFNYASLTPGYQWSVIRWFDGFTASIAIVF
jgi:hypothetical protein